MSTLPIDLADVKAHLNITENTDDAVISEKLAAASQYVEHYVGQLFEDYVDGIPHPLKEAVRQVTAHFYENREPVLPGVSGQEIPLSAFDLMNAYRKWVF